MPRPRVVLNKHRDGTPKGSRYIGRGSPWGNPFRIGIDGTREEVIERFRVEVMPKLDLEPLRGFDLVCYCAPLPCHGDPILEALYGRAKAKRTRARDV